MKPPTRNCLLTILAVFSTSLFGATIGTTSPTIGGGYGIRNDSGEGLGVFAETFKTPDATNVLLTQITLYFAYDPRFSPVISYKAAVAEWDISNQRLAGAPLWISSTQLITHDYLDDFLFAPATFTVTPLSLDPSKTYALLALPTATTTGAFGYAGVTTGSGLEYSGNMYGFYLVPGGGDFNTLATNRWNYDYSAYNDLGFSASFSASRVPESMNCMTAFALMISICMFVKARSGVHHTEHGD